MSVLRVLNIKDDYDRMFLQTTASEVEVGTDLDIAERIRTLSSDMIETMFAQNGVGLAAPQIGESLRMFVMMTESALNGNSRDTITIINPVMHVSNFDLINDTEGCLSIPGVYGKVDRYTALVAEFDTEYGSCVMPMRGLMARVFQHEYDHLNGKLFIDKVTSELTGPYAGVSKELIDRMKAPRA